MKAIEYVAETGVIVTTHWTRSESLSYPPAGTPLLILEDDHPCIWNQERYLVNGSNIIEKDIVTLVPNSSSFLADGVSTCVVSHNAGVPISVLLQTGRNPPFGVGSVYSLSASELLTITVDAPTTFTFSITDTLSFYATPIRVEAV